MESDGVMLRQGRIGRTGLMSLGCAAWCVAAWPVFAQVQRKPAETPVQQIVRAASPEVSAVGGLQGEVVREIDDPECGDHWLLLRDESDPGGPGRLVLVQALSGGTRLKVAHASATEVLAVPQKPVIRAGDRLVIEQETPLVSARLEAVALGPAAVGKLVRARLKIGGQVVEARVLAPGRATLAPEALR